VAFIRVVRIGGRELRVELIRDGAGEFAARVTERGGCGRELAVVPKGSGALLLDGHPFEYGVTPGLGATLVLHVAGREWVAEVLTEAEAAARARHPAESEGAGALVRAPMPGRVLAVEVEEGQTVGQGASLFIIEAMKMENEIRAPRAGRVRCLHAAEGDAVEQGQALCEISPAGEPSAAPCNLDRDVPGIEP
jgi:biotin carboxyl carrier protein